MGQAGTAVAVPPATVDRRKVRPRCTGAWTVPGPQEALTVGAVWGCGGGDPSPTEGQRKPPRLGPLEPHVVTYLKQTHTSPRPCPLALPEPEEAWFHRYECNELGVPSSCPKAWGPDLHGHKGGVRGPLKVTRCLLAWEGDPLARLSAKELFI